ncbi:TPA: SaeRS system activator ScrA, partial [Staphylococcus aureus]
HTLNSSSAIIEQHTMSNLASLDLYAPVRNITSSRDIHPIYFMTKD